MKPVFRTFAIVAAVAIASAATARAKTTPAARPTREHPPIAWFVLVSHRIDLAREASRMVSASRAAEAKLLTGPRYVINLTSGVLVDGDGHVVTHLVNLDPTATEHDLKITTPTGAVLDATFLGLDQPSGLAVLSVPGLRGAAPPPASASAAFSVGESVRVVFARQAFAQIKIPVERVAIYPTLLTSAARVVEPASPALARGGVAATLQCAAISSSTDVSVVERGDGSIAGLALYASPGRGSVLTIPFLRDVVARRVVQKNGTVEAGWLGAQGAAIADVPVPQRPAWAHESGVLIRTVTKDSPAFAAGLRSNDLVVGFDGVAVRTSSDLLACVGTTPVGTKVALEVVREGAPITLETVLGGRPLAPGVVSVQTGTPEQVIRAQILDLRAQLARTREPATRDVIFDQIRELEARLAAMRGQTIDGAAAVGIGPLSVAPATTASLGVAGAVKVGTVAPGSAAAAAGLRPDDLILRANGYPTASVDKLDLAVSRARANGETSLALEVSRGDERLTITVALAPAQPPK